ncbi:MAG: lamin tail domain-containing protein [Patescibacteria group bacterium]|nr:lamin tail domain-containing protein [Patescibacteria group bacterium]
MSKKVVLFLAFIILLAPRCFIYANLEINEVMYDLPSGSDDGREWIEVYNNSDSVVDLSTFKFSEGTTSDKITNHKLILSQGDANLIAHNYALIVSNPTKFKIDYPNFSGIIFDSSFSLNNTGEILIIKDKNLNIVDQYIYNSKMGAAGDDNSLQKINGVWLATKPTPGMENKIFVATSAKISDANDTKNIPKGTKNRILDPAEVLTPTQNLFGNVVSSNLPENNNFYIFLAILMVIIGAGSGAVYFVRKNKAISKEGDDFDILDE